MDSLKERLEPNADGTRKVFRDSVIGNLLEFVDRFHKLHVGSSDQLELLVTQAKSLISGTNAYELRSFGTVRQEVSAGLAEIADKLAPMVVQAPRRKIVRLDKPGSNGTIPEPVGVSP